MLGGGARVVAGGEDRGLRKKQKQKQKKTKHEIQVIYRHSAVVYIRTMNKMQCLVVSVAQNRTAADALRGGFVLADVVIRVAGCRLSRFGPRSISNRKQMIYHLIGLSWVSMSNFLQSLPDTDASNNGNSCPQKIGAESEWKRAQR